MESQEVHVVNIDLGMGHRIFNYQSNENAQVVGPPRPPGTSVWWSSIGRSDGRRYYLEIRPH